MAEAAGGELVRGAAAADGPVRAVVDSRAVEPGDLFVGLPGERADGGAFAAAALRAGAWGVLVAPEWAASRPAAAGAVIAAERPARGPGRARAGAGGATSAAA